MTPVRTALTLALTLTAIAPALAQGIRFSPTTMPFRPQYQPVRPYPPIISAWPYPPATLPIWPGYGGLGYYPYGSGVYYGPGYPYTVPSTGFSSSPPLTAPPLQGAGGTPLDTRVSTNPEMIAELTIAFPAEAEVTVNGKVVPGEGKVRTLQSPPLKSGIAHTFDVKARWTLDGQTYEWERTVALTSGERSRITVARGFPVKDEE